MYSTLSVIQRFSFVDTSIIFFGMEKKRQSTKKKKKKRRKLWRKMLNTMRWTIQTHTLCRFFYFICVPSVQVQNAIGEKAILAKFTLSNTISRIEFSVELSVLWKHTQRPYRAHRNRIKAASIAIKPNESCASKEWIRKSDWTWPARHFVAEKEALLAQLKVDLLFFCSLALGFCSNRLLLLPFAFILYFVIRLFAAYDYESTYYVYNIVCIRRALLLSIWHGEWRTISICWLLHPRVWYTTYMSCVR